MSHSNSPTDTRTILQQNPRLSDDSEVDKAIGVPSPPVRPLPHDRGGATGIITKKTSK